MDQLRSQRPEILRTTESAESPDPLAVALSPIFLACIARARRPEEILEEALILRDSEAARGFRAECRDLVELVHGRGEEAIQRYKLRIATRLKNLNDLLFERGERTEWVRQFDALTVRGWIGWFAPIVRKVALPQQVGDASAVFLGDVLSQSLGVLNAQEQIRAIFGTETSWDTYVISCATPKL